MEVMESVKVSPVFAGLVGVALLLSTGACSPAPQRGNEPVPPELTFDDLEFRVYRGAALSASGRADWASFRRDTSGLAARAVTTWFPATGARPEARVEASRGEGNLREHRFVAAGGVRAEQGGQVATTEVARYLGADAVIRGDRPIEVRGGSYVVRGPGFTLDPRDQVLHIEGGASVVAGGVR
jgi:hypothetical protein